jgi:hypothetical protein
MGDGYLAGTVAYLNLWHDVELTDEQAISLYAPFRGVPHMNIDFRACDAAAPVQDAANPPASVATGR